MNLLVVLMALNAIIQAVLVYAQTEKVDEVRERSGYTVARVWDERLNEV